MTGGQKGDNCSNSGGYTGTHHATSCTGVRFGNSYSAKNASGIVAGRGLGLLLSAGNLPSSPQCPGEKLPVGVAIPNQDLRAHTTCERPGVRGWGITVCLLRCGSSSGGVVFVRMSTSICCLKRCILKYYLPYYKRPKFLLFVGTAINLSLEWERLPLRPGRERPAYPRVPRPPEPPPRPRPLAAPTRPPFSKAGVGRMRPHKRWGAGGAREGKGSAARMRAAVLALDQESNGASASPRLSDMRL